MQGSSSLERTSAFVRKGRNCGTASSGGAHRRMRILFVLPLTGLLRHFESVVVMLADRGHTVGIATPGKRNDWPLPQAITSHPNIQRLVCPEAREDQWRQAATDFRLMVDCGRYLGKPFAGADKLRARAFQTFVRTMTNDEKRHLVSRC